MPTFSSTPASASLRTHADQFLQRLAQAGYSPRTLIQYRSAIHRLVAQMEVDGLAAADLDSTRIAQLKCLVRAAVAPSRHTYASFCLDSFVAYLVETGAAPPPSAPHLDDTPMGVLRREYEDYLRRQRGLSDASIVHGLHFLRRFMAFRFGDALGDLNAIAPDDITRFLLEISGGGQPYRDKTPPSHLRNLFKFLFWSGKTTRNLAEAIPRVAQPKRSGLPRHLPPDEVRRLIDAVRSDTIAGRRNYAMLMMIARLGLRAPEVIAIQLGDVDWRNGEILIRGKGGLHDRMPLPAEVGEAVVDYIQHYRKGASRTLFVHNRAPYKAFDDAQVVNAVLRDAFAKTGLKPPQKYVGSHVLRHSLATDLLRKGASLDEIGDVLRHRSRMTTTIYAKHDIEMLRSIVRAWPTGSDAP